MRNKPKVFLVILMLAVIFLAGKFAAKPIKNTFHLICSPAEKNLFQATEAATGFFGSLINIKQIETQNEEILKEYFALIQENSALRKLKQENNSLRQALGINKDNDFEFAFAEVISKQIISDALLINSGAKDGLKKGMVVITPENVLVGKISEVFPDFSRVSLISVNNNSFDIKIEDNGGVALGMAKGLSNFKLSYDLIPKSKSIKIGDKIFTNALAGNFPEDLLVGEVLMIKKTDAAPYQAGIIAPYFNRMPFRNILIIKNFSPVVQ